MEKLITEQSICQTVSNNMKTFHSFTNHKGLAAVYQWDKVMHRNKGERSKYLLAAALAIVNKTPLPPAPFEGQGKTKKPWRSWECRVETIKKILDQNN